MNRMNGEPLVSTRLAHVAERFSAFYSDLEAEKQARRDNRPGCGGCLCVLLLIYIYFSSLCHPPIHC